VTEDAPRPPDLAALQNELRYLVNRWDPIGIYDETLNFPPEEVRLPARSLCSPGSPAAKAERPSASISRTKSRTASGSTLLDAEQAISPVSSRHGMRPSANACSSYNPILICRESGVVVGDLIGRGTCRAGTTTPLCCSAATGRTVITTNSAAASLGRAVASRHPHLADRTAGLAGLWGGGNAANGRSGESRNGHDYPGRVGRRSCYDVEVMLVRGIDVH
jgi:hypothetical protein